jgi:sir2 silent information regulator family NAD-dependent deacetylase
MTKIQEAKKIIEEADKVVIGAGAGLSAAAGLTYSGSRFQFFF